MNDAAVEDVGMDVTGLADLAQVQMGEVAERRSEALPIGFFRFQIASTEITKKDRMFAGAKRAQPVIPFKCVVQDVVSLTNPGATPDPSVLLGKQHTETFPIDPADPVGSLGYVKAFLTDIGMTGQGTLQELLQGSVGLEFIGAIKHTPNKNDPDEVYANLNRKKIKPYSGATVSV